MIYGFSKKRLKSPQTLSEKLKNARRRKKLSLSDAEAGTKVRSKYLLAIEEGKWNELEEEVYTRGFVLAYAKFLKLDVNLISGLYESEMAFKKNKCQQKIAYNQSVKEVKVLITPKLLAYAAVVAVVLVMISYIIVQLAGFAGNPNLQISSPSNNVVLESDTVLLSGTTDVDTFVRVNNENVPVTSDGRFATNLTLHRGINVINVKAVNKAKKESAQTYTVEYKPKTASIIENTSN